MASGHALISFHESACFAWKADAWSSAAAYTLDLASADLAQAYEEVRSGKGFVVLRGLRAGGTLEEFVSEVRELGRHFGHLLSQNARGELVHHVIDEGKEDRNTQITAMIALACWQKAQSGGASVIASAVTVHDEMRRRAPRLLEPLYRGYYYHRFGEQGADEEPVTPYRIPVFSIRKGQLSCRYQRARIAAGHRERGLPLAAVDIGAFNLFEQIAKAPENRLALMLERGDVLVINNYTILHAHARFTDFPQPERQRRLIRLWLDAPDFRDVPKEFNLFKTNGVPGREGRRAAPARQASRSVSAQPLPNPRRSGPTARAR